MLTTEIVPRIRLAAKALLRHPEAVNISVTEFLKLWGPEKVETFVSIGANDGVKNDPLAQFISAYAWRGIMVEPLPDNFVRLAANFGTNSMISLENSGISDVADVLTLYYLRDVRPEEPDWYDQVASFDKETFFRNISVDPTLIHRVRTSSVPSMNFDTLMAKHSLEKADLIMIDAEGYDGRILASIDLKKYEPKIIIYENEWLTQYDSRLVRNLLRNAGYHDILCGVDCVAYKRR